jgi:hypothetical protein
MSRFTTTHITANTTVHTGSGAVISLIISHAEASTQTVILYDSPNAAGDILATFQVSPEASPKQIIFPAPYYLRFRSALTVAPGKCSVILQSVG